MGGHVYDVELVDRFALDPQAEAAGIQQYDSLRIKVCSLTQHHEDKKLSVIEATLWHELVHAISYQYSLSLGEDTVDGLSQGIQQVLSQLNIHLITESPTQ